jgi:hypothetical protein
MKLKSKVSIGAGVCAVLALAVGIFSYVFLVGHNDDQNWQVRQSVTGNVKMIDGPGWYMQNFATVWTWPRSIQAEYSRDRKSSVRGTFNDGGTAEISTLIRFQTPVTEELRRKAHRDFAGQPDNMSEAVRAHLINVIKASAPLMSASEHQSARKAEFTQIVDAQLRNGLYKMRKVERELKDRTDENGEPILVFATEIITDDDGMPIIAQISPLQEYGIQVLQFSVTETQYDENTRRQFEAKKQSYLKAEQSKAEREQEVQQRLMVEEKGLREKAEITAQANVEKAQATIAALKEKEVAETEASKLLEVARLNKETAETKAAQQLEVAKLEAQAAEENARAILVLAEAEEKRILKAGAITEEQEILAKIWADRDVRVAEKLSQIEVPNVIMSGGQGGNTSTMENLINLKLLEGAGVLGERQVGVFQPVNSQKVKAAATNAPAGK